MANSIQFRMHTHAHSFTYTRSFTTVAFGAGSSILTVLCIVYYRREHDFVHMCMRKFIRTPNFCSRNVNRTQRTLNSYSKSNSQSRILNAYSQNAWDGYNIVSDNSDVDDVATMTGKTLQTQCSSSARRKDEFRKTFPILDEIERWPDSLRNWLAVDCRDDTRYWCARYFR